MDTDTDFGELIFSIVIGYLGALEFFFVVRRLYHLSCGHDNLPANANAQSLEQLQSALDARIADAGAIEAAAGTNVMQDGVLYHDGFRIEPTQLNNTQEEQKQREIAAELERQWHIQEETRKQLEEAEAKLAAERQKAAEEKERQENEQRLMQAEQQRIKELAAQEAAEAERKEIEKKIFEAEQQRLKELAAQEAAAQEKEQQANAQKLHEAEQQRQRELAEAEVAAEQQRQAEAEAAAAAAQEHELFAAEAQREQRMREEEEAEQARHDAAIVERLLEAERARKMSATESELEEEAEQALRLISNEKERAQKQKLIEENARRFLEAEEEMIVLQQRMLDAGLPNEYAGMEPVVEPPCIKKNVNDSNEEPIVHKVKTQFGQVSNEQPYSVSSKPLIFPGVSDDGTSIEPNSSKQSSLSTQASDEFNAERQEPDGEDNVPDMQYTEEYLRSLDGIGKSRPLVREDGSGRRRAFKKRRSSGSSNSSRESRHSREEELKMFTSLEEEELRKGDKDDYNPIKYTNEPTLKVKSHHRRHKRSPAKDIIQPDSADSLRGSLEMLGEENTNPWGEVVPEHYKDTEFWKREKAMSIDEEDLEFERPASGEEKEVETTAINLPKTSSFEEATHAQNEEAANALQGQITQQEKDNNTETSKDQTTSNDNKSNLQASSNTEDATSTRSSSSPRLRRSPRVDEMDQYEERWRESEADTSKTIISASTMNTPTISLQTPDVAPWRDQYGLIMEGLSDFYDFTASVNPSRSRSTSRNPSPVNTAPSTPLPRNVANTMDVDNMRSIEVYDDTGSVAAGDINAQSLGEFIEQTFNDNENAELANHLQNVADDASNAKQELMPMVYETSRNNGDDEMNSLVQSLREQRTRSGSRSRSRSPLPTADNLERSIETRRSRLIKQNDELRAKLDASAGLLDIAKSHDEPNTSEENIRIFVEPLLSSTQEKEKEQTVQPQNAQMLNTMDMTPMRPRSPLPATLMELETMQMEDHISAEELMGNPIEVLRAEERLRSKSRSPLRPTTVIEMEINLPLESTLEINTENIIESMHVKRRSRSRSLSLVEMEVVQHEQSNLEVNSEEFVESLRVEQRGRSRSRSFVKMEISSGEESNIENSATEIKTSQQIEETTQENMQNFIETLRVEQRSRCRSRSRSPLPTTDNVERSLAARRQKRIQHNDELFEKLGEKSQTPEYQDTVEKKSSPLPTISIECFDSEPTANTKQEVEEVDTPESISRLVEQLRLNRSRSHTRSKSPLPSAANIERSMEARRQKLIARNDELFEQLIERAKSPEPPRVIVEYVFETEDGEVVERDMRSLSPSRSRSLTPNRDDDNHDFHLMLNLEASNNRTLNKNSEELESVLAAKQREVDREALLQLNNASEEVELRILSPTELQRTIDAVEDTEPNDNLNVHERMHKLRCTPTTPDYERTISEEWEDVERIKQLQLEGAFQRSTYVGESLEMGGEYENLRREAAEFQRSHSPSPSLDLTDVEGARAKAAAQRELQAAILDSLASASGNATASDCTRHGAIPKSQNDLERTFSEEVQDTQRIKEEQLGGGFKRSTYVGESVDMAMQLEDMRHRTAEFERSRSQSRSPPTDDQIEVLRGIDAEAVKRELQDHLLDQLAASKVNFQSFSRHLNADFLDSERRASDSALIQKPEFLAQFKDNDPYLDLEPEEYHHFRRYSLAQEQPVEEYPDDYVCVSQIEVRTMTGTRTWLKEDFYGEGFDDSKLDINSAFVSEESFDSRNYEENENDYKKEENLDEESQAPQNNLTSQEEYGADAEVDFGEEDYYDEGSSNDSEDERQTVVEIEDEFDEGISDYNERGGPTDESHHETSECEEAEREADRYANRGANDWEDVENVDEFLDYGIEEGAVGGVGTPYSDPDSFIEQIYHDAIKNRKQSGILRDYESIFQDLQTNNTEATDNTDLEKSSSESDRYAIWAKNRELGKSSGSIDSSKSLLESERRDGEVRYLGDANVAARQSTRLRSRYGYNPQLQSSTLDQDIEVDLNYTPKREYNWRKNFKLDDDNDEKVSQSGNETTENVPETTTETACDVDEPLQDYDDENAEYMDMRRISLGGESITLFSRSPVREVLQLVPEEETPYEHFDVTNLPTEETIEPQAVDEMVMEKPKKKKSKKKTRKGSKSSEIDARDEDDSESQLYSRRSSSIHMEEETPKRKSRSRRSSKSSLTNDEPSGLFSPRSSIGFVEGFNGIAEENEGEPIEETPKKKTKKRKKVKEANEVKDANEIKETVNKEVEGHPIDQALVAALAELAPVSVSTNLTPASTQQNLLATLSAAQSFCVTPASSTSEETLSAPPNNDAARTTPAANNTSVLDTFDILKDANFYPLF